MVTEPVPWPLIVAEPPTTCAPSGPAAASEPSATSTEVVSNRSRRRGDIGGPSISSGQDQEGAPIVTRSGNGFCDRKVSRYPRPPAEAKPPTSRSAIHIGRCTTIWGDIVEPAPVGKGIKLNQRDLREGKRYVESQFAEQF